MIIKEALRQASKKISQNEAEILLAFVLNKDKAWPWAHDDEALPKWASNRFAKLIARRLKGEPIPYLTNHQEFYGLDFYVNQNVLIPRPETEILVDLTLKEIARFSQTRKEIVVTDVGAGSGCISVAIAVNLKIENCKLKIYAIDISKKALVVAKINAEKHKVIDKITFLHGNLLKPLPKKIDIIAANLPYVNPTLFKRVSGKSWTPKKEPQKALLGGKSGLELIKKLLYQAPQYLNPNGTLLLEISPEQKKKLIKIINNLLPKVRVYFIKDYSNKIRVLKLILTSPPKSTSP